MTIKDLQKKIIQFRDARDWKQFHNPKDSSLSLVLEAAEVMEHFQWKSTEEIEEYIKKHNEEIGEELSDVLFWVLLMCHDLKIDVVNEFNKKLKKNEKKYPVKKVKGKHIKYTEL